MWACLLYAHLGRSASFSNDSRQAGWDLLRCHRVWFKANSIVDRVAESLFASQVAFRRLYRNVSQQKLNLVQRAVMAPDIAKVDPDRHLDPGLPAWNFRDEVLRWLLHGQQSLRSDPKDLLISFPGTSFHCLVSWTFGVGSAAPLTVS
jgi:hypothetical protein